MIAVLGAFLGVLRTRSSCRSSGQFQATSGFSEQGRNRSPRPGGTPGRCLQPVLERLMSNQTVAKAPKKHDPTKPTGNRSFIESSWCAETLFLWLSPLIQTGYERTLQPEDLPDVRKIDCAATNHT